MSAKQVFGSQLNFGETDQDKITYMTHMCRISKGFSKLLLVDNHFLTKDSVIKGYGKTHTDLRHISRQQNNCKSL